MNPVVEWLRALAGKVIVPQLERRLQKFRRQLQQAAKLQRQLLFQKLRRMQQSAFGRDHGFAQIRQLADFRRQVPIAGYDYYAPYIRRVAAGEVTALFPAGERLLMFTLSSGTTAEPKIIPITPTWMREYRYGWQIWGIQSFLDHPALFYAKLAGIAGNWDMRRTPSNLPCGMASGLSAKMQSLIVKMVYCMPDYIFQLADPEAKYYAALRMAVPEPAGLFMTATPGTVVKFARLGDQYREQLIRDIAHGTIDSQFAIPDDIRQRMLRKVGQPNPLRAKELEAIVTHQGHLYPKDYWPLSLVACWLGGTVGTDVQKVAHYFGPVPKRDIGLLCSEGRFTIPIQDETPAGVLEVTSHYYEFIPESEIDAAQPTVLEAHELVADQNYYILLTTSSGLYRYHISDVMRCHGFEGQAPILEFLNKGSRFADLEGEKISEHQLVQAVREATAALGVTIANFTAVPIRPETDRPPYYLLFLEEQDCAQADQGQKILQLIDAWFKRHNVMYEGKRGDGYLGPWQLRWIPTGSWANYDAAEIQRRGVSEDHYKHPCLVLDCDFPNRFPTVRQLQQG